MRAGLLAAAGLLVAWGCGAGCEIRGRAGADARGELRDLERALADLPDVRSRPLLASPDLDALRALPLRDAAVKAARDACLRQYEAIIAAWEGLARCRALEERLEARLHDAGPDAEDPAMLLAEAEKVCAPAFRAAERIDRARRRCDDRIGTLREGLGLPR
jgi:hypothetical protein